MEIEKNLNWKLHPDDFTQADKDFIFDLAQNTNLTLNGIPAQIAGRKLRFAVISDKNHVSFEYSWKTVYRVIKEKNGEFKY